jgi:hypothetical protein
MNVSIKESYVVCKVGNIKRRENITIMISLKILSLVKSLDLKSYDL